MRLRLLSLFFIIKVCRLNIVRRDVCPPLPQLELTKPLNTKDSYQENYFVHYQCVDGYVRMAGTSSRIICKQIDQVLQWKGPTLKCIPYPSIPTTIESSTTRKTTLSPTVHLSVPTERVSPRPTTLSSLLSPTLRGNTEKSSATAIYVGVGGVVVTVLLVAAFGVLMFGRRKWMQRLDLSPTPDEVVQINVVT